jgi:hypothetical protein
VPYVQGSVWWRAKKTVRIMVGAETMRVWQEEATQAGSSEPGEAEART